MSRQRWPCVSVSNSGEAGTTQLPRQCLLSVYKNVVQTTSLQCQAMPFAGVRLEVQATLQLILIMSVFLERLCM